MTAYDSDARCTGRNSKQRGGHGLTAGGTMPLVGVTAACPRTWMGRWVDVPGFGFRLCEDTGKKVRAGHVDVYVQTHAEALAIGLRRHNAGA